MATLLNSRGLSKSFGTHTLFSDIGIGLAEGDRLGSSVLTDRVSQHC